MATVSATQHISTITPPSSSHGAGNGSWPLPNEKAAFTEPKSFLSQHHDSRQAPSGSRKMSYGSEKENLYDDVATHKSSLGWKRSDATQEGGEYDENFGDMYRAGFGSRSVPNGIEKGGKRKTSNAKLRSPEEVEDNWIHRDKLAQIESRELEEAGFTVPSTRAGSRSVTNSSANRHEHRVSEETEAGFDDFRMPHYGGDTKRQRVVSPVPNESDEAAFDFELRTPEEVAAEQDAYQYFHAPPARPNATRIPMPKTSAVPVPAIITERDSPLTRSRNGSNNMTPEIRPRSRSISSQILFDEEMPRTPVTAGHRLSVASDSQSSPPRGKVPVRTTPGSLRGSTPRVVSLAAKPRNPSQQSRASPEKRPGTSSGRPGTSHRPEGDPPWLATMYKPDPRLPPEQQMLPTHAKRMAQEQWEKEGKTGTVYDRDFRLLNTDEPVRPLSLRIETGQPLNLELNRPTDEPETRADTSSGKWPLASPVASPKSAQSRSETPGTVEHGRYSTMPRLNSAAPSTAQAEKPREPREPVRMQEPVDEEVGKKGCCCIIM